MDAYTRPSDEVIEYWQKRLVGKYVLEAGAPTNGLNEDQIVRENEIPSPKQLLPPGAPQLRNLVPGRINVFMDETRKVTQVYYN